MSPSQEGPNAPCYKSYPHSAGFLKPLTYFSLFGIFRHLCICLIYLMSVPATGRKTPRGQGSLLCSPVTLQRL